MDSELEMSHISDIRHYAVDVDLAGNGTVTTGLQCSRWLGELISGPVGHCWKIFDCRQPSQKISRSK